jgi:hypothetical protein
MNKERNSEGAAARAQIGFWRAEYSGGRGESNEAAEIAAGALRRRGLRRMGRRRARFDERFGQPAKSLIARIRGPPDHGDMPGRRLGGLARRQARAGARPGKTKRVALAAHFAPYAAVARPANVIL